MLNFIAYQEELSSGGTVEDVKDSLHEQANNIVVGQLAERFQEQYGA